MKSIVLVRNLSIAIALASGMALAQAPPSQNVLGVVTKVDAAASKLTLKTDAGAEVTVNFQPKTIFQKVAPGENGSEERECDSRGRD